MKTKWVITIGREFCSGGAETAHKVAQLLDKADHKTHAAEQPVEPTHSHRFKCCAG